ncbi:MAG: acetylglutamate kinase [Acidobacteria bacterium]|nr:acetylglutamate kinase [Acidobacteriota bacterium]MCH8129331.1 acetylglutamate kinase [Acidobacteriota bacterium]
MTDSPGAAAILSQALPHIQRLRGQTIVAKTGGRALADPELARQIAGDVVLMHSVGIRCVVVHGGGPQISEVLDRFGKETEFIEGHRVTDAESLEITRMVLVGKVNRDIVSEINRHGPIALGVSGEDAGLILAEQRHPELGFVGNVKAVNPHILERLLAEQLVPVVSTIGTDEAGQAYNINADVVAGAIAAAVDAAKLIYLTDVDGLLEDVSKPGSLTAKATDTQIEALIEQGSIRDGMLPKLEGCLTAVHGGVGSAHIVNATTPHSLLVALTDRELGTTISRQQ